MCSAAFHILPSVWRHRAAHETVNHTERFLHWISCRPLGAIPLKNPGNTPVLFLSYPLISSRLLSCQLLSSPHIFLPVLISSPILSSPPISSSGFLSSHLSSSHLLFSSFIFVSSCPLTSPLILLSALLFIRLQWHAKLYVAVTLSLLQRTAE